MARTCMAAVNSTIYHDRRDCVQMCNAEPNCRAVELHVNRSNSSRSHEKEWCQVRTSLGSIMPCDDSNVDIMLKIPDEQENCTYIEAPTGAACIEGSHLTYLNETLKDCMYLCDSLKDECKGLEFVTTPAEKMGCRICGRQSKHCNLGAPPAPANSTLFIKGPADYNFTGQYDLIVPRNQMYNITSKGDHWDRTLEGCALFCTFLREDCECFTVKGNYPLYDQCLLGFRDQEIASPEFLAFAKIGGSSFQNDLPTGTPTSDDMLGGAAASTGGWKTWDAVSIPLLVFLILLLLCLCCCCFLLWMKQNKIWELKRAVADALLEGPSVAAMSMTPGTPGDGPAEADTDDEYATPGMLPLNLPSSLNSPSIEPKDTGDLGHQSPSIKVLSSPDATSLGAPNGVDGGAAVGPLGAGGGTSGGGVADITSLETPLIGGTGGGMGEVGAASGLGAVPAGGTMASGGAMAAGGAMASGGAMAAGGAMASGGAMAAGGYKSGSAKSGSRKAGGYRRQTTKTSKKTRSAGAAFHSETKFAAGGAAAMLEQFAMEDMAGDGLEMNLSSQTTSYKSSWHDEFLKLNDSK